MEFIEKYKWAIVAGAAAVVIAGALIVNYNTSKSNEQKDEAQQTSQEEKKAEEEKKKAEEEKAKAAAAGNFGYTAREGDSYSVLARKAVQAYANDTKTTLSQAQIVAAETQLTVNAGSPLLEVGQKVDLVKNTVKSAVDAAAKLTAEQQSAWQAYVPYVNFDTSQNG